ncbi:MAG: hypothetical protein ACR2FJ_01280 [Qipengyuania sp.]
MSGKLGKKEKQVETVAAAPSPTGPASLDPVGIATGELSTPGTSSTLADGTKVTFVSRGEMPPPAGAGNSEQAGLIDRFFGYALAQTGRDPARTPRDSALLAAPGLLRPERMACASRPPAVLIDIDPGKGTFDPLVAAQPHPRLPQALAALRAREISVFWISRLGEDFGDSLREVLAETGLDPRGEDQLLLLRTLDERKQTRRVEIARRYCPVAVLGDERADFDELYLYLKHPETALALDAMLDAGWFLLDPVIAEAPGTSLVADREAR